MNQAANNSNHSQQENIQNQLLTYSEEAQQQQTQKAKYKASRIKDLFPTNYFEEMSMFFQRKCSYNPHFEYSTVVTHEVFEVHQEFQDLADKIFINNSYAPELQPVLTKQQVLTAVNEYLQKIGLQDYVQVLFSTESLSRTSVLYYKSKIVLKIRLPLSYTKLSLQGTLNHEVGTHIVRYLNHKENSQRKPTKKSKIFEQGLAALNQLLPQEKPILFKAALRYKAVIHASRQSFSQVFKFIHKYIKDQTDCWRQTVRAKRGMIATQKPGAYYKDQNYFIGAVQILRNRKNIDFQKCFYSKLSYDEGKNIQKGVLPPFLDTPDKKHLYIKKIYSMALCNFIDSLQSR